MKNKNLRSLINTAWLLHTKGGYQRTKRTDRETHVYEANTEKGKGRTEQFTGSEKLGTYEEWVVSWRCLALPYDDIIPRKLLTLFRFFLSFVRQCTPSTVTVFSSTTISDVTDPGTHICFLSKDSSVHVSDCNSCCYVS